MSGKNTDNTPNTKCHMELNLSVNKSLILYRPNKLPLQVLANLLPNLVLCV